jgi:hypothetical protein
MTSSSRATTMMGGSGGTPNTKPKAAIEQIYSSPIAVLTIRTFGANGTLMTSRDVPISRTKTILGRLHEACDVALDDAIVSSRHLALFVFANRLVFLEDLGSTNGSHLLSDPPLPLDAHTRLQWSDGTKPTQFAVGLGGSGKVQLSLSAVEFPIPVPVKVPPTLVDDDDDVPPALVNFERRKSQQDIEEEPSPEAVKVASPVAGVDDMPPPLPQPSVDIDATLDYEVILAGDSSGSPPNVAPIVVGEAKSRSLAGFCVSPPQHEAQVTDTTSSAESNSLFTTKSSSTGDCIAVLSATPPPALPNTLASTKSQHCDDDDDYDESPPPPSSAIRRCAAPLRSHESISAAERGPSAGTTVQATLDVGGLSPAKRVLAYEEERSAPPAPVPRRSARAASEEAPSAAAESSSSVKKRQREPEEDGELMVSSATQASLASSVSSAVITRRGDSHHSTDAPVIIAPTAVEGGPIALPLAPAVADPVPVASPPTHRAASVNVTAVALPPTPPSSAPEAVLAPLPVATARWQFKVDLRKANSRDEAWEDYPAADSAGIETAFAAYEAAITASKKRPKKTLIEAKLSTTYGVHFEDMVQFRYDDRSRQRPIRRKAL